MREDGSYTKEEFLERKQEIDNQIAAVKISMAECRIDQFNIEAALAYAIAFIRDLGRQWFDLPTEIRPRFQKLLFPEGIPYTRNKGFVLRQAQDGEQSRTRTAKLSVIFELNQQSHGSKYHTVDLGGIVLLRFATADCSSKPHFIRELEGKPLFRQCSRFVSEQRELLQIAIP